MDFTLLPAHEQARLIAGRAVSARELMRAVEQRYTNTHAALNAVIFARLEQAHQRADEADRAVMAGDELGPLHGVPATVKDVIDWAGTPSTWGDPHFAEHRPTRNAVALDRLEDAGAIVWGKTNVPLDLGEWQTFNDIHGRTNNPYALDRTPGGSSGGSAVSLATGLAGVEIGSDIGGSIRFPSHYCGVFGHKPSFGAVSPKGHDYPGQAADADVNVVGPMARSARDLEIMMRLLSDRVLIEEPRESFAEYTVGVMFDNPLGFEQDTEMTRLLEHAVHTLESEGLRVSRARTGIKHDEAQQNYLMLNYAATSKAERGPDALLSHGMWIELANQRERIRDRWSAYFETVDLLLCPVAAGAAPHHETDVPFPDQVIEVNGELISNQGQWVWAGMASGAYLPATVAPIGQTAAGLPVGLQIIAPFGHDLRSIRFAGLVESVVGGFVAPPMVSG